MDPTQQGKSINTSVPSISIKFHANDEKLEDFYESDDEQSSEKNALPSANTSSSLSTSAQNDNDSSPLKFFPRLVKRSTSVDVGHADASPPSDPWRFLSDIKGKITKSVEDKITEIKSRNLDEGSPLKSKEKNSKENSSLSDLEDLSESSLSKTCGVVSTTEGVEMSSDEDTPSLKKDKKRDTYTGLRQRFRFLQDKTTLKEGTVNLPTLSKLYNVNTENLEQALPETNDDIESGVDALMEDKNSSETRPNKIDLNDVLNLVDKTFDNITIDDEKVVNINEINGADCTVNTDKIKSVFAPVGFVDLRTKPVQIKKSYSSWVIFILLAVFYVVIQYYYTYLAGILMGVFVMFLYNRVTGGLLVPPKSKTVPPTNVFTVPQIKEHQPLLKFEGWMNELPETYTPDSYHIYDTQSVFLRVQGNFLRLSSTSNKIPKRAMWNEPVFKPKLTFHRTYNLLNAKISLLPVGLTKIRYWSKKYPICVTLSKDQLIFDEGLMPKIDFEELVEKEPAKKSGFSFGKKKHPITFMAQRFSKLTEEQDTYDFDSDNSTRNSPSPTSPDSNDAVLPEIVENNSVNPENDAKNEENLDCDSLLDGWSNCLDESPETKIYLFGRTDREKEDWFRRLTAATKNINSPSETDSFTDSFNSQNNKNDILPSNIIQDYQKYMSAIKNKALKKLDSDETTNEIHWLNHLMGRVIFDCLNDLDMTLKIKQRIERKLSTIKLPYFIEELLITELNLGKNPPLFQNVSKPTIDERGLWVDFLLNYEGSMVCTLMTKINLMKLKQPHENDKVTNKSAIFHSDIDDSAESSSDDDSSFTTQNISSLDSPVSASGEKSNTSKKIIKMVDRIAESKIFQAATEYSYIKRAMEGVSNTHLKLKVELKALTGTLVLNIPPPPSDRIWLGFKPVPDLIFSVTPIVGERSISFQHVVNWIEKKLTQEFYKVLVIPNMEDFIVPVMIQKLPE